MTFNELINHFGTQQKVADALGFKQPTVCGWNKPNRGIPRGVQAEIQIITGGILQADAKEKK